MKFESDVFQIWLLTTINTLNAIVKFFSFVKLDTFAKSPVSLVFPKIDTFLKFRQA